jgi:hypothetical protein
LCKTGSKIIFCPPKISEPLWGLPPAHEVTLPLSSGLERLGLESDHPTPPSAEIKNGRNYNFTPPHAFMTCTGTDVQYVYTEKGYGLLSFLFIFLAS